MPDFSHLSLDERRSHFRNLVAAASRDGSIASEERIALAYAARKWGLSQADAEAITANPDSVALDFPESKAARFHQLYDIVELMMMDGVLKKTEKELCHALATKLGFGSGAVDVVKDGILAGHRAGMTEDKIQAELLKKF